MLSFIHLLSFRCWGFSSEQNNKFLALMEKEKLLKQTSKQAHKQTNMSGCDKRCKEGPNEKAESGGGSNLTKVREGLYEEMTFKQRPEGRK